VASSGNSSGNKPFGDPHEDKLKAKFFDAIDYGPQQQHFLDWKAKQKLLQQQDKAEAAKEKEHVKDKINEFVTNYSSTPEQQDFIKHYIENWTTKPVTLAKGQPPIQMHKPSLKPLAEKMNSMDDPPPKNLWEAEWPAPEPPKEEIEWVQVAVMVKRPGKKPEVLMARFKPTDETDVEIVMEHNEPPFDEFDLLHNDFKVVEQGTVDFCIEITNAQTMEPM
jgi:hypothetical protein